MVGFRDPGDVKDHRLARFHVLGGWFGEHIPVHPGRAQGDQGIKQVSGALIIFGVPVVLGDRLQRLGAGLDIGDQISQQGWVAQVWVQFGQGGGQQGGLVRAQLSA